MLSWYSAILLFWHPAILLTLYSPNPSILLYPALLLSYHSAIRLSYNPSILQSFNPSLIFSYYPSIMLSFYPLLVLSFNPILYSYCFPPLELSEISFDLWKRKQCVEDGEDWENRGRGPRYEDIHVILTLEYINQIWKESRGKKKNSPWFYQGNCEEY